MMKGINKRFKRQAEPSGYEVPPPAETTKAPAPATTEAPSYSEAPVVGTTKASQVTGTCMSYIN